MEETEKIKAIKKALKNQEVAEKIIGEALAMRRFKLKEAMKSEKTKIANNNNNSQQNKSSRKEDCSSSADTLQGSSKDTSKTNNKNHTGQQNDRKIDLGETSPLGCDSSPSATESHIPAQIIQSDTFASKEVNDD